MAYPSTHAGSEIDQAVDDVINRIWLPMSMTVSEGAGRQTKILVMRLLIRLFYHLGMSIRQKVSLLWFGL